MLVQYLGVAVTINISIRVIRTCCKILFLKVHAIQMLMCVVKTL